MKRALILGTFLSLAAPVAAHAGVLQLDTLDGAITDVTQVTESSPTAKKPEPVKHTQHVHSGTRHTKVHTKKLHTSVGEAPKSATIFDERPHKVEF